MTTFSVTDAKNGLSRLIDRALQEKEVVISPHGKPVAELRPLATTIKAGPTSYAWLKARRQARKSVGLTSVELLRQVYDDPSAPASFFQS
jgi:prevent-host-death family protein